MVEADSFREARVEGEQERGGAEFFTALIWEGHYITNVVIDGRRVRKKQDWSG